MVSKDFFTFLMTLLSPLVENADKDVCLVSDDLDLSAGLWMEKS